MAWQEWSHHVLEELKRGNTERIGLRNRVRSLELKIAFAAGVIVVINIVVQLVVKYLL